MLSAGAWQLLDQDELVTCADPGVLIGVVAIRGGAALWTRDAGFERVRTVLPGLALYGAE